MIEEDCRQIGTLDQGRNFPGVCHSNCNAWLSYVHNWSRYAVKEVASDILAGLRQLSSSMTIVTVYLVSLLRKILLTEDIIKGHHCYESIPCPI